LVVRRFVYGKVADGGRSIVESVAETDESMKQLCTKDAK